MRVLSIFLAVLLSAAFFLRDADLLSSAIVLILLVVAASVHLLRQKELPNQGNPIQCLRSVCSAFRNIGWVPFLLLVVELLSVAIAAHFVVNELDAPYERLREWFSHVPSSYLDAYFS